MSRNKIETTITKIVLSSKKTFCWVYLTDGSAVKYDFEALNINYVEALDLIYLKYSVLTTEVKMAA